MLNNKLYFYKRCSVGSAFIWLAILSFVIYPCLSSAADGDRNILKVGFLCVGPISDWGWNYTEEQGRLYLEKGNEGQSGNCVCRVGV